MPFHIAPFPGQTYPGRYADHADIRAYLGLGQLVDRDSAYLGRYVTLRTVRLPLEFHTPDPVRVPLMDGRTAHLYCLPGNPAPDGPRRHRNKSSAHRCFVVCPDCRAHVPAGRTHQHKCK